MIILCRIDEMHEVVRRAIQVYTLLHEYAHTLLFPIMEAKSYQMRTDDSWTIEGKDLLVQFAEIASRPLADREELLPLIHTLLHAKLVTAKY